MEQKNIPSQTNHNSSTTSTPQQANVTQPKQKPVDQVLFVSEDKLFAVKQLVGLAQRYPYSDYPCIVMQGFPAEHERIRRVSGGGVELMLTHEEFEAVIDGINAVSESQGKGTLYKILKRIPPKSQEHKLQWRRFNESRRASRPNWWKTKPRTWRTNN